MDFTQATYKNLLVTLKSKDFSFLSFESYLQYKNRPFTSSPSLPFTIIRHDVDRIPQNSLKLAQLEHSLGIKGTYYFRIVPESYDLEIMNQIASLGHEIGYHYENVDLTMQQFANSGIRKFEINDLIDAAYESFCNNLELFRKNFDIKTICMHGSPRAKYDNKIIWDKYDYKELGIIGEPYFDLDFNEFAYFTDTGRRWNGDKYSIRDKVKSKYDFNFKSTQEIIANIDELPDKVMFTVHPERWHSLPLLWTKELVWQNLKNVVKRLLVSRDQVPEVRGRKPEDTN